MSTYILFASRRKSYAMVILDKIVLINLNML